MIVLGVDVSTRQLGVAAVSVKTGRLLSHEALELPRDAVNRLARAYEYAQILANQHTIVVPEWPMGRSRAAQSALDRVLGAFLAGCNYAAWVHPGMSPPSWKLASVGHGKADKAAYLRWANTTYALSLEDDDIAAAICIAHAGRAWWNSQRKGDAA